MIEDDNDEHRAYTRNQCMPYTLTSSTTMAKPPNRNKMKKKAVKKKLIENSKNFPHARRNTLQSQLSQNQNNISINKRPNIVPVDSNKWCSFLASPLSFTRFQLPLSRSFLSYSKKKGQTRTHSYTVYRKRERKMKRNDTHNK